MKTEIIIIGAHPDDIEIGAGGLLQRLQQLGYEISACILSSDGDQEVAELRQNEAREGIETLGLPSDRLFFLNLPDGGVQANSFSIERLRKLLSEENIHPEVIITHSLNDSHNDHRATAELVLAAFRRSLILHFGIVNSLISSSFSPSVFVDTTNFQEAKRKALQCHYSQDGAGRIHWQDLENYEKELGELISSNYAEGFEISIQHGQTNAEKFLKEINDSPFNLFWSLLLSGRRLIYVSGTPRIRTKPYEFYDRPSYLNQEARSHLSEAFRKSWRGAVPFDEHYSDSEDVELLINTHDVLLEGGAVSNRLSLTYFNHIPQLRYIVDYDIPGFSNIRIRDRAKESDVLSEYESRRGGIIKQKKDWGLLTIIRNPINHDRILIGCMGIHGDGTSACAEALCDNNFLKLLLQHITLPFKEAVMGYQMLLIIDCRTREINYRWDTLEELRQDNR